MRDALNASTWESLQDDSEDKKHPILREARARSWRDLEARSKCVCIHTDRRIVKVLPSRWATKAEGGRTRKQRSLAAATITETLG